jgi:hypothetical protein
MRNAQRFVTTLSPKARQLAFNSPLRSLYFPCNDICLFASKGLNLRTHFYLLTPLRQRLTHLRQVLTCSSLPLLAVLPLIQANTVSASKNTNIICHPFTLLPL